MTTPPPSLEPAAPPAGAAPAASPRTTMALRAAAFTRGPVDLLEFLVPLWAGPAVGASATATGLLVATQLAVSVVARPVAGHLADHRERRTMAALGAVIYALSCLGYWLATVVESLPLGYAAAVVGGIGGSLLWVSLRSLVGEQHEVDTAIFPKLMRAEETGTWVAFVAGLSLLAMVEFGGVFLLCAGSCLVGAGFLMAAQRRTTTAPDDSDAGTGVAQRSLARTLSPLLLSVAIAAVAESAVAVLLLLHLQRHFGLGVIEIAWVFLPGAIAMAVLPTTLHRFVVRVGRRRALAVACVLSAGFAVGLALAPNPWVIAAMWLLSGVAWALITPVEQSVLVEAVPGRVGRGMGLYEAAILTGGALGVAAAGVVYEHGSWQLSCGAAAVVILAGAVVGPWSLNRLRSLDFPAATAAATAA